jgi:hypothetical protein
MRSSPPTEEHVIDNLKSKKATGHLMIAEVRDSSLEAPALAGAVNR